MSSEDHYNRAAERPPVQCMEIRAAHRQAKRTLIHSAAALARGSIDACRILDLACGRGGDLPKCIGCAAYTGVDTAHAALEELHRRAAEMGIPVVTYATDATQVPWTACDLAMCNFAIHYFCDTKAHCQALLDKVASCLTPGGTFCGTYERRATPPTWGESYHAVVGDCVDAIEWKVPWHEIVREAHKRGMALVYHVPLTALQEGSDRCIWAFIIRLQAQEPRCGTRERA